MTVLVQPADAPYTYAEIRGTATLTTEGGQELIDELSQKYVGKRYAEFNPAADQDAAARRRARHPAQGRRPPLTTPRPRGSAATRRPGAQSGARRAYYP